MDATIGELASYRLVLCDQLLNGRRDPDEGEGYVLRSERLHERRKARAIGDAIEFLDRPDVVTVLREAGGEGVPEGSAGGGLRDARLANGLLHGALQHRLVHSESDTSELDDRVLAVTPVEGVDEADHAPAVRHQDRARADAAAEEAHAPHERAVGDARRDEEDVRARGQVLLRVDPFHVGDAHAPHALLLTGLGRDEPGPHAAVEAAERRGRQYALGCAADPHDDVDVGPAHRGRDPGRQVAVADQLDAGAGTPDVGNQLLVPRPVEHDHHQVAYAAAERARDRFQVVLHRGIEVDDVARPGADHDLLHVAVGRVQQAAPVRGGEDRDRPRRPGGAEVRTLERVDGDVDFDVV